MLLDKIKSLLREIKEKEEFKKIEMKKKMDEHIRIENDLNEIFSKAEEFNTGAYMIMLYRINNYLSSISKKNRKYE